VFFRAGLREELAFDEKKKTRMQFQHGFMDEMTPNWMPKPYSKVLMIGP
jgi:hypothetical protein